ncbi:MULTISPECIES: SprT-like domain-containing protein [unclassified Bradyrhizobium]|uniref:SprT-like domain-containing protein n=1 Tax=unclassified Bradyrhizobium TaxID=2631580 RepID=UPI00291690F7|nr:MULTISPECIES: SprT-like domain-containing protein [unclassified Bradyrhizobium]
MFLETSPAMNPTGHTYGGFDKAYDFFNERLFGNELPRCLITLQRHKGALGFFAPERFGTLDGENVVHEIALNPTTFARRTVKQILSTLAHEMAHLWQQNFGSPSRNGYHNKEWGTKMKAIGLYPSNTGAPGGKETGQQMTHYIVEGGSFDLAFAELEAQGIGALFADLWEESEETKKKRAKKAASKAAFVCPDCSAKAWAKASASLICGDCEVSMECTAMGGDDEGTED